MLSILVACLARKVQLRSERKDWVASEISLRENSGSALEIGRMAEP